MVKQSRGVFTGRRLEGKPMYLYDVIAIALSVVGFLLSLQGLWLICRAMWPQRVEASAARCERNGVACFFIGLILTGIMLLIVRVAGAKMGAPGKLIALVVLFFYVMYSGVGTAGFVTHIGRRLPSPADGGCSWRTAIRGGIALELAYLIPVLGWFGILPISLIIGAGAATMAIFSRADSERAPFSASHESSRRGLPRGTTAMPVVEAEEVLR